MSIQKGIKRAQRQAARRPQYLDTCRRKDAYYDRALAQAAAARLGGLQVYRCDFGEALHWHIGNRPDRPIWRRTDVLKKPPRREQNRLQRLRQRWSGHCQTAMQDYDETDINQNTAP